MHAEKRELRIGHGVDEAADQMLFGGDQVVVFAAERDDLDFGFLVCHAADTIAVQAGAVDQVAGAEFTLGGFEDAFFRGADDTR